MFFSWHWHTDESGFDDWFYEDFWPPNKDSPKPVGRSHERCQDFPKLSENYQIYPKTTEDFRGRLEDVSMIQLKLNRKTWYQWNHRYFHKWEFGKYGTRGLDMASSEFYERCIFQWNTHVYIINLISRLWLNLWLDAPFHIFSPEFQICLWHATKCKICSECPGQTIVKFRIGFF